MRKRWIAFFMAAVMTVSLAACGSNEEAENPRPTESETVQTETGEAGGGETADEVLTEASTPAIDLNAYGMTDVRGKTFPTTYRNYGVGPQLQALLFTDAAYGIYVGDLDQDQTEELLIVTLDQTISEDSSGVLVAPTVSLSVFEAADDTWEKAYEFAQPMDEIRYTDSARYDVFLDQSGAIYLEYFGTANHWADGIGYSLHKYVYDGEERLIALQSINTYSEAQDSTELFFGGSGLDAEMCVNLDTSLASEEDIAFAEAFINSYRALGFTETTVIRREDGTMDQNSGLTKICRIDLVDNMDSEKLQALTDASDFSSCGSIDYVMIDYQNVEAKNSGVPQTEGTAIITGTEVTGTNNTPTASDTLTDGWYTGSIGGTMRDFVLDGNVLTCQGTPQYFTRMDDRDNLINLEDASYTFVISDETQTVAGGVLGDQPMTMDEMYQTLTNPNGLGVEILVQNGIVTIIRVFS